MVSANIPPAVSPLRSRVAGRDSLLAAAVSPVLEEEDHEAQLSVSSSLAPPAVAALRRGDYARAAAGFAQAIAAITTINTDGAAGYAGYYAASVSRSGDGAAALHAGYSAALSGCRKFAAALRAADACSST